MNLLKQLDRKF